MTEQKIKQILGASVASAVILLSVLISVVLYQAVLRIRTSQDIKRLENQIQQLSDQKQQTQDEIDIWLQDWKIDEIARELGYFYGDDKK